LHPDSEGTGLLGVLDGTLHCPSKGDPAGQLVGDTLRNEGRIQLRLLDLLDVELDPVVPGDLTQAGPQAVGFGALSADDDPWPGRVHIDPETVAGALNLNTADSSVWQLGHEVLAHLPVLNDVVGVLLPGREPSRLPVGGHA
jgi:hypothetical protein